MNPRKESLGSRRRGRWLLIPMAVVAAGAAAWTVLQDAVRHPQAVSLAQAAKSTASESAAGSSAVDKSPDSQKRVNLLYTVNNLGYTTTCG